MGIERAEDQLTAATMYYLQDQTMEAIGQHLGVSRSTVSRLLGQARASGLVEITLHPPAERSEGLAGAISERFGVQTYVVPVSDGASDVTRLQEAARAAARLLAGWFESGMTMGVAWGNTLATLAGHLPAKPTQRATIVQLNGAAYARETGVAFAGEILAAFARAFEAAAQDFPVPAFFDYAETKAAMWRERSIRRILEAQERVDVAVFSVGAVSGRLPSHVYAAGYLDPGDLSQLRDAGVVGDVCTVFLRADGSYRDIALNERATGPNPDQLRSIPRRLCVVAGEAKVAPLLAALRAGVVTDLVTDETTATSLAAALRP